MSRWTIEEIDDAFQTFQAAALKGGQTQDWQDWTNCFTEDANYFEHHYGKFWGRENILNWIRRTMAPQPVNEIQTFPNIEYSIDVIKGWVVCEVMNSM